jgi:hypothetical protein
MNNQEVVIRHIFKNNILPELIKAIDPFVLEINNKAIYKAEYKANIGYDIKTEVSILNLETIEDIFVKSLSKIKVIHD